MINFKYKFQILLLIFISLLLIEGFFYFYSSKLSYFCFEDLTFSKYCDGQITQKKYKFFNLFRTGYNSFIWNENGIVETLQIIFVLFTIYHFSKILVISKKKTFNKLFYYFLYFYLICLFYYLLEEISWGQHYFNWNSNDFFLENNNQRKQTFTIFQIF